jgi:hypothetical protein
MAIPGSIVAVGKLMTPGGAAGPTGPVGPPGSAGGAGVAGLNAWTTVITAGFTVPAYGANVTINVADTSWMAIGEWLYIDDAAGTGSAGQLVVVSKTPTTAVLVNPSPTVYLPPLASPTQNGAMRQVSGNTTDFVDGTNSCQNLASAIQPTIGLARLRAFNSLGNPNMEVDQRNADGYSAVNTASAFPLDRWQFQRGGGTTMAVNLQQNTASPLVVVPGSNFAITRKFLRVTLTSAQASLAANDYLQVVQTMEGPQLRELINDVHSVSLLVRGPANLSFALNLRDSNATHSFCALCTLGPVANTWTLFTLPNLPWTASGSFPLTPGNAGYVLGICLACGTSLTASANNTWLNGNFIGAIGMSNFAAQPANTTFDIAFVQHEPGPICTTLIDKPFSQNLDESLRYYQKTYSYGTPIGAANGNGAISFVYFSGWSASWVTARFKKVMAIPPTVTGFHPGTGAANSAQGNTGAFTITSIGQIGDAGFSTFAITPATSGSDQISLHYTADTHW